MITTWTLLGLVAALILYLMTRPERPEQAVECRPCEGTGEICVGHDGGSFHHPPEPIEATCPICEGEGMVLESDILAEWERWPTAEDAVELANDRIYAALEDYEPEWDEGMDR